MLSFLLFFLLGICMFRVRNDKVTQREQIDRRGKVKKPHQEAILNNQFFNLILDLQFQ